MSTFEPKPFGKYFLIDKLAVGGMAEIYKAKTFGVDGFEKQLAIKKILPHYSADKEFIAMLTDEAKLAVRLSHTNIVQIYDLGKVGDDYYISMEFIDGINLRELMNRGKELGEKIPVEICLYIGSEICKGLDYAHSKRDENGQPLNIVHRDISPQNILISFEGETKIVDFGIAKAALNISHTTAGILKGKVTYMSSEQALGKPVDARTDIFSAGIILHEMLTGERLFTGETQIEVLKIIQTTHITGQSLSKKIPAEIRSILAKALAFSPNDRYGTAGDFQIALTKALYSQYVDFSPRQLANLIKKWFAPELKVKKKKTQEQTRLESETLPVIPPEVKQESIVHREEPFELMDEMMAPTTKPEDWIKPGQLRHTTPESVVTAKEFPKKEKKRRPLWPFITAALAVGGVLLAFFWSELEPKPLPSPTVGEIDISSEPDSARISVDNRDTGQVTPTTIGNLELAKSHHIRLEKEGFKPWEEEIDFAGQELVTLSAKLEAIVTTGFIDVGSTPPSALIFVNGADSGQKTPSQLTGLKTGDTYQIKLVLEGYRDFEQTVTVTDEKPVSLNGILEAAAKPGEKPEPKLPTPAPQPTPTPAPIATPTPKPAPKPATTPTPTPPIKESPDTSGSIASLRIDSSPRGASVVVNGQKSGVTPIVIRNLRKDQTHTVVVAMPGYKNWTRSIQTSKNYTELIATLSKE
ncbi:MAG: serine/threonine protein kinase [Deltaproteobacteria bacterium]|nr:serine/threonine protein kinase [Deltaproteobacteria bacterium]